MKRGITLSLVVTLGAVLPPRPAAAQADGVRAAMIETLAAWRDGDFDRFAQYYHPETRGFFFDGGYLVEGFNREALEAAYEAGFRAQIEVREIDVKVYGNTAVGVAYADGTITLPGGATQSGTWRYSETRVNEGGVWKIVQYHFSKLEIAGM
ncbi:MAG: YybH family protein [Gemmatimonadales bacterium]